MKTITEHFLTYQFVYIFFCISLIFIILAMFTESQKLKLTVLVLFAIFFVFFVTEMSLAIFKKAPARLEFPPSWIKCKRQDVILCQRDVRLYNQQKKTKIHAKRSPLPYETVIYDAVYSRYANNFRYTKGNLNSNENYIFLGCSFTFGSGVNDDQTMPYYFSKLMNFEKNVLNFGINSRATNSAKIILESDVIKNFAEHGSHTKYIFYYVIKDHILRNFSISRDTANDYDLLYAGGKWKRLKQPFGGIKHLFAGSYIFNVFFLNIIDKYNLNFYENYMLESIKSLKKIAENKYNSGFIVIVWPDFDKNFIEKLKKTGVDCIFLPVYFNNETEYTIKDDWHPNARANKEIADILFEYINSKNFAV